MTAKILLLIFICLNVSPGNSQSCGEMVILKDQEGMISGQIAGHIYNTNCTWLLQAEHDNVIRLEIMNFSIESTSSHDCHKPSTNFLEIYDGETLVGYFCGSFALKSFVSLSQRLFIRLSVAYIYGWEHFGVLATGGFVAKYTQVKRTNQTCSFERITHSPGVLEFSGIVKDPVYLEKLVCTWLLVPNKDKSMQINITYIDIQFSDACMTDYLEIYDNLAIYGRFCGTDRPPSITSKGRPLFVYFQTEALIGKKWFSLTYGEVNHSYQSCGNHVTLNDQSGFIRSPIPDIDGIYAYDTKCTWLLTADSYKAMQLEIMYLNIMVRASILYSDKTAASICRSYLQIKNEEQVLYFCGYQAPPAIVSTGQSLEVKFYFEYAKHIPLSGRGFNATYSQIDQPVCSFFMTDMIGEIVSIDQNGDGLYENNLDCTWTIWTNDVTDRKVQIYFTRMDIPSTEECKHDYLEIYDATVLAGVYCGSDTPPLITTSSNYLVLKFHSNKRIRGKGYSGIYKIIAGNGLGGEIYSTSAGKVSSVSFVSFLREHTLGGSVGSWLITIPDNQVLNLQFIQMDFPLDAEDCPYNYLEITDSGSLEETYCGEELPPSTTSTAQYLTLTIHIGYVFILFNSRGFTAVFVLKGTNLDCGGIHTSPVGEIAFSGRPTDEQNFKIKCIWIMAAPDNHIIELNVTKIDFGYERNCTQSFIQLFENSYDEKEMHSIVCDNAPTPNLVSASKLLFLQFWANKPHTGISLEARYAFVVAKEICFALLNETSARFGKTVDALDDTFDGNCRWKIQAKENHAIDLKILVINIANDTNCTLDFLRIYDGESDAAYLLGSFCGTDPPPVIQSSSRDLYVHFHTDRGKTGDGFEATFVQTVERKINCGGVLNNTPSEFRSPDYDGDGNYDNNLYCEWTLITEPGYIIQLFIDEFDVEYDKSCRYDRLTVYDGFNRNASEIGSYCGIAEPTAPVTVIPTKFRSTANAFHVLFISDSSVNAAGILARFSFTTVDAWRRWPDGDYSIPMSIYGCPDHDLNHWKRGYINISFTYPIYMTEKSRGKIEQEHELFTVGPFGKFSHQLNFCTKVSSGIFGERVDESEWPSGKYAIYKGGHSCPLGFEEEQITLAIGIITHVAHGWTPPVACTTVDTRMGECHLNIWICIKQIILKDTATLATDLRAPFTVLSPDSGFLTVNDGEGIQYVETTENSMLIPNSTMEVIVEDFVIVSPLDILGSYGQWLIYWLVTPKDTSHMFYERKGNRKAKVSSWALGLPTLETSDRRMWLSYDFGERVHVTFIRFVYSKGVSGITGEYDNNLDIPSILLSHKKWLFLNHGACYCLPHYIKGAGLIEIHCLNDPEFLSVRFVTIKENSVSGNTLERIIMRDWSLWIFSDKDSMSCQQNLGMEDGYIENFQVTSSSASPEHPSSKARPGDVGWCTDHDEDIPYIQVDLLYPAVIEGVMLWRPPQSFDLSWFLDFLYSNDSLIWLKKNSTRPEVIDVYSVLKISRFLFPNQMSEVDFTFNTPITTRFFRIEIHGLLRTKSSLKDVVCLNFELIGCRNLGVKNLQCGNNVKAELKPSQNIPVDYFYSERNGSSIFDNSSDCLALCQQHGYSCSVNGDGCVLYGLTPSTSYGMLEVQEQAYIRICLPDEIFRTSLYLTGDIMWENITTDVRQPGIITSHDFPLLYGSGELWCWYIFFNSTVTVNLIFYNISFNRNQAYPEDSDTTMRFSDNIDRLIITKHDFDADLLLSDYIIDECDGVIFVFNKSNHNGVPHLISKLQRIRLFWRTPVQYTKNDMTARGFRLLAYASSEEICLPSNNCMWETATVVSTSFLGEVSSYTEIWSIYSAVHHYIYLQFEAFDISCGTESLLDISLSASERHMLCNSNKPVQGLKSNAKMLVMKLTITIKPSLLIEGFKSRYELQTKQDPTSDLLSKKDTVRISPLVPTTVTRVCSEYFKKCYILVDDLQNLYKGEITSWAFVQNSLCGSNNWTLVSLHSKTEQDFIGYTLLHSLNYTNNEYTYIGLRSTVRQPVFKWRDNSPVTYTAWEKGHPSQDLDKHCTKMSLRLSEDHKWESIPCDVQSATAAVCQYIWKTPTTERETVASTIRTKPISKHLPMPSATSIFICDNTEIISILGRCDSIPDCSDETDEVKCADTSDTCTSYQFRCDDGQCVSTSVVCDNIPDCKDGSDEECYFPACALNEYRCNNQRCIRHNQRCDGKDDCFDGSDEESCVESNCNDKNSFLCSSTECIPYVFVCDGIADCTSGRDEINCEFPDSCQAWWEAGYHKSGLFNIRGSMIECDFGHVWTSNTIVAKFHNIDHGRLVSFDVSNNFSYSYEDALLSMAESSSCYQTIDQLCQPWVQRLYFIDKKHNSSWRSEKSIHACQCIRYRRTLTSNATENFDTSVISSCSGQDHATQEAFHFQLEHSDAHGIVQSMKLKEGHVFDTGQLQLVVYPVICSKNIDLRNGRTGISCGYGFTAAESTRCLYKTDVFGHIVGCRSLEHLQNCDLFHCPPNYFKCANSFCIEKQHVCDGVVQCLNGEDEEGCDTRQCNSAYRCLRSNICLPQYYLCDGFPQCPESDDEKLCNFACPDQCLCLGFLVTCSELGGSDISTRISVPANTRTLDISRNAHAFSSISFNESNVVYLIHLNLSACGIRNISSSIFFFMRNLIILDLSSNYLIHLPSRVFSFQTRLKHLRLEHNMKLLTIYQEAFLGLESMNYLGLNNLQIRRISKSAFAYLNLEYLDLSRNIVHHCENNAFETLTSNRIYFNETNIQQFSGDLFKGLEHTSLIVTNSFKFCCVRPYFLSESNCFPQKDDFSSCEDLMRNDILRPLLWIVGILALIGNALTFVYRLYDKKRMKLGYGIFVSNLSISDFLMGIYLIIIASADMHYRGSYFLNDEVWRNSLLCRLAGVLAALSSETSILFICLITLDRLLVVRYPLGEIRMTQKPAWISSVLAWLMGLFISVFPILYQPYFKGEFYSKSGICLALPLTSERPTGWLYSVILFIGFNLLAIILVVFGQWLIFTEVTSSIEKVKSKSKQVRKKELRVARNLLLVAMTDFLCWFPIGLLGLVALSGRSISGDVYAWIAVFVLPINSALNPFLYTLTAILKKDTMSPEEDEHTRTLTFERSQVIQFFDVWKMKSFFMKSKDDYKPLTSMYNGNSLTVRQSLTIAKGILSCLHRLHIRGIAQKNLMVDDIFVISTSGRYSFAIDSRPELAIKDKIKAENIRSFGVIFTELLNACEVNCE